MTRPEFETLDEVKSHLGRSSDPTGAAFQSLDPTAVEAKLRDATLADNVRSGCRTSSSVLAPFQSPVVFPTIPDLPFNPFRSSLYSPEELLGDDRKATRGPSMLTQAICALKASKPRTSR